MRRSTRRADERGTVMILAVGGVVLAMISAALAVDLGRLAQDKRFDQKAADLAALDASRDLTQACARAKVTVERNGFDPDNLLCSDPATDPDADVVIGTWSPGPPRTFTPGAGGDAVKVTARSDFKAAFPFVGGVDGTKADAVAQALDVAGFSLGSNLASLTPDDSTTLNRVFTALLGTSPAINLTALGYQGLASGFVSLTDLVAADAGLGTPDELLTGNVTVRRLAQAAVIALNNKGDAASLDAATRLATFAANIDSTLDVQLSDILSVQQPGNNSAVEGHINVLDIITTAGQAAQIANGVNLVSIPGLTVGIPGLTQSDLKLHLIEAPRLAFGPARVDLTSPTGWATWARTAQMGIELTTRIQTGDCLVLCVDLRLPIVVDAAKATGSLTALTCAEPVDDSVAEIRVDTLATDAHADMTLAAQVLNLPVPGLSVVEADIPLAGGSETKTFTGPFPTAIQSTAATGLGLATLLTAELSVLNGLVDVGAVLALLDPVTTLIDNRILEPLFQSLGLSVAGADVRALTVGCGLAALVA